MITPHESYKELAQALGFEGSSKDSVSSLFFKREDLHPLGSHKGRSIPGMIDEKVKEGCRHFAISSSGNAALAAGLYIKALNEKAIDSEKITLEILAGENINPRKLQKLEALRDRQILLSIQDRPLQALFMKTQDPSVQSLRQSSSPAALVGYHELAQELLEIKSLKAVFMPTSSGTTAQALAEYFIQNKSGVEVHIVQTSSCHTIAESFVENYENYSSPEKSIADAIVDKTALRKDEIIPLITKTNGSGWIASNEEITAALDIIKKHTGLSVSANSALSVVGLMQAVYTGKKWDGSVACMICGD